MCYELAMNEDYTEEEKTWLKEAYKKLPLMSEEEKQAFFAQLKKLRNEREGDVLFSSDIHDQNILAARLGFKLPSKK